MTELKPSEVTQVLRGILGMRKPILIVGPPGVGKSELVTQACAHGGFNLLISHPVVSDPTDFKGMPFPMAEKGIAEFLPFGDLAQVMACEEPTVWFLDDIGQAAPATQAALMQPLGMGQINGKQIPACVTMIGASNRRQDRAGVSGMLEPVKSRFVTILHMRADLNDWKSWAYTHQVHEAVIGLLTFRPDLLHQFTATADLTNSPCPRTWSHASTLLKLGLGAETEQSVLAGAVGEGAASELAAYVKMYRELPDLDEVLRKPEKAPIFKDADAHIQWALCVGLATRTTEANFPQVVTYAERLVEKKKGEFAVVLIRDAMRKEKKIATTKAFQALGNGPFGEIVVGVEE